MSSTTSAASRRAPSSGSDRRPVVLLLLALLTAAALPALADPRLHELRATRRAAVRAAALTKADGGASFGLLVVPVDFADARFAADYDPAADLAPRLGHTGPGDLGHYFDIASGARTRLVVILAPVISLPGPRTDYSDIGWQGNERTRRLASEALTAARDRGVDFAAADADGDGEVDGVLLLHAAPGLENDLDGLIVPLQFFLEEPVVDRGTLARCYAVAAERSTLGIWAHETAHLLGLEDRYDPNLAGDGEAGPRGGLGRFSLMASGWLGTGAGADPALPDAYSRLAMGWIDLAPSPVVGAAARATLTDPLIPEYFLVEQRDPAGTAPYDAGIPSDRALIYHVDETLADGQASSPVWPRHLRVQLVEADGGEELARGENEGTADDLYPFANTTQRFDDDTIPDARTWSGADTGAQLTFTAGETGLVYADAGLALLADVRLPLVGGSVFQPLARLPAGSTLPDTLTLELTVTDPQWGQFADGTTVTCDLVPAAGGAWQDREGPPLVWQPGDTPPAGATTRFTFAVAGGAVASGELVHVWDSTWSDLDLAGPWPGDWRLDQPGGNDGTVWHRWQGEGALPAGPVLACTGDAFTSAAAWPEVSYGNDARSRLLSPPLGTDVRWIELRHSPHLELLHPGLAVDGVTVTWVHAGGATVRATSVDGWLGSVDPRSRQPLAGEPTFAVNDGIDADARPLWRREVLPLPDPAAHGPGPWNLRLELASNPIYRDRGWLVHGLAAHLDPAPASAFPLRLDSAALHWTWEVDGVATCFDVERSDDGGQTWQVVASRLAEPGAGPDHVAARAQLGLRPGVRSRLRVVAGCGDRVVSREIIGGDARDPALSMPRPNPCSSETSIRADGAGDSHTEVGLFDLRGRRVEVWRPGGEPVTIVWEGDDSSGRRVAAGVYIFRLRAQGRTLTRKVTWLP